MSTGTSNCVTIPVSAGRVQLRLRCEIFLLPQTYRKRQKNRGSECCSYNNRCFADPWRPGCGRFDCDQLYLLKLDIIVQVGSCLKNYQVSSHRRVFTIAALSPALVTGDKTAELSHVARARPQVPLLLALVLFTGTS